MPYASCHKKKVTGRYQLQFPLKWVRDHLKGRTAEEWREIILAAWETSSPDLQQQWRNSFKSTVDDLMKKTLTVKNRTGRRFDRDAYAREAHFVYGPAVSPCDASPKLLARCFKHSVDFVLHHGLSNSTVADSCTNTGEHTVPSDTVPQALPSESSTKPGFMMGSYPFGEGVKFLPQKMHFSFGRAPPAIPDSIDIDVKEEDDRCTRLLDEMLDCPEEDLFSCEEDFEWEAQPDHTPDMYLSNDSCPSSPLHHSSSENVWRSTARSEDRAYTPGWEGDVSMADCVERQLLRAREDLAAARQQRDDAVRLCQQLQAQLAEVMEQREQSPGTDVPEDGCFRGWVMARHYQMVRSVNFTWLVGMLSLLASIILSAADRQLPDTRMDLHQFSADQSSMPFCRQTKPAQPVHFPANGKTRTVYISSAIATAFVQPSCCACWWECLLATLKIMWGSSAKFVVLLTPLTSAK